MADDSLFSIQTFRGPNARNAGWKDILDPFLQQKNPTKWEELVANAREQCAMASPTEFHAFLAALQRSGQLARLFTQNIDNLEAKAGIVTYLDERAATSPCIHLHGVLEMQRCIINTSHVSWVPASGKVSGNTCNECPGHRVNS